MDDRQRQIRQRIVRDSLSLSRRPERLVPRLVAILLLAEALLVAGHFGSLG